MTARVFNCVDNGNNHENPLNKLNKFLEVPSATLELAEEDLYVYVNGQIYQRDLIIEEIDVIIRIVRKNWFSVQDMVLDDVIILHEELMKIREEINKCLQLVLECLKYCDCDTLKIQYLSNTIKQIRTFTPLVRPVSDLEENVVLKILNITPREICPLYQYLHTFFDVQYYLLILGYICGRKEFENRLQVVLNDLILISVKNHQLRKESAFNCDCVKKFWLIVQILCEKSMGNEYFWQIFNKTVENCDNSAVLWLLKDVAYLQALDIHGQHIGNHNERIKPNYVLLEASLKKLLAKIEYHQSLLPTLKAIEPVVGNLWLKESKIEIYQSLYESLSKKLNISNRNITNLSMIDLVELIDTILWTPNDCSEDFELFLGMLAAHLNEHPYHWGKMKGRIYSQLGPNKVKDLNDTGIFHVMLLFVALTKVNFEELSKKFVTFVENLPVQRGQTQLVWSFYTSLIVRHVRENRNLSAVAPPFMKLVTEASKEKKFFHLIKIFVDDYDNILKYSNNLQLHQWLLIDSWIHKYLSTCYYPDLIATLKILLKLIDRVTNEEVWCEWELVFKNHIYPILKHISTLPNPPEICGTLSAKIALSTPSLLSEAFAFFNSDVNMPQVSSTFLCCVLDNYPCSFIMTPQQEVMALQTWVRTCLLTKDNYANLTENVIKLDVLPSFVKTELVKSRDPLVSFIECLSVNVQQHMQSSNMNKLCENCFGLIDQWLNKYFLHPENEAVILRIYTCMALAFFKIGPLLYNRHKSNCPYTRISSALLFPTDLIMGKPLHSFILQAVKKTWHLFFGATIQLNSINDPFVERTLRELVVKYVPHFTIVDSPMLKCLDNETTAEVILDKMSDAFFKHPTKEAESNVFKSLRIINDFVQSTTSVTSLKLVVNKTLYGLLEVIMFHSQRNTALSVVKTIVSSPLYRQVKSEFEACVVAITEKHLPFNTVNYFQLMGILAKFISEDLKNVMPRVKQQISNVERMRGVGFDKNLRLNLEKLERSLTQTS